MGMTGRVGLILMVLSGFGWIVYMLAVFAPAFHGDVSDFNIPGQALLATTICGVSVLLGWFLMKENLKFT